MKILLLLIAIAATAHADHTPCQPMDSFSWSFYGLNLTEDANHTANTAFDLTDITQIGIAAGRGVRILFYLQNILFKFNVSGGVLYLRENWQEEFSIAFGNADTGATNPYGLSGLYANNFHGFYLGTELKWNGISNADLTTVVNWIKTQFPVSPIAYSEHYAYFRYGLDLHQNTVTAEIPTNLDIIAVTRYWPDIEALGGTIDVMDLYNLYIGYIYHKMNTEQQFIWAVPMYHTDANHEYASCHPQLQGETCDDVCAKWMVQSFTHLCFDRACDHDNPIQYYYHTNQTKGLWGWHWNDNPSLDGYEGGVSSSPYFRALEAYMIQEDCSLVVSAGTHIESLIYAVLFAMVLASLA